MANCVDCVAKFAIESKANTCHLIYPSAKKVEYNGAWYLYSTHRNSVDENYKTNLFVFADEAAYRDLDGYGPTQYFKITGEDDFLDMGIMRVFEAGMKENFVTLSF